MTGLHPKLKIIILPYLLISTTVIAIFSFAKWFFEVKHRLLLFNSFVFDTVAASILTIVLILTILRRRLHILDVRDKNGYLDYSGYYVFILISIILPLNFALNYVGSVFYDLKHVSSADEIITQPLTRYYSIDTLKLEKEQAKIEFYKYISGKHNTTLNFDCYVIIPVVTEEHAYVIPIVWFTKKYHYDMSNNKGDNIKESAYNTFVDNCNNNINSIPSQITDPVYYDNVQDGKYRENFTTMILSEGYDTEQLVLLVPEYGSFNERTKGSGTYFIISWLISSLVIIIAVLINDYHEKQLEEYYNNTLLRNDSLQKMVHYLHRHRYHPLALLMMIIIIGSFVILIWRYC